MSLRIPSRTIFLILSVFWSSCGLIDEEGIGEDQDNHAFSVRQTSDGGFIVAGATTNFGRSALQVYLVKLDAEGGEQWTKTYGGDFNDAAFAIRETSEGGYIVTGYINRGSSQLTSSLLLLKLDASGEELWNKSFSELNVYLQDKYDEQGFSVEQTTDGGYIAVGEAHTFASSALYMVRTDAMGEKTWSAVYSDEQDKGATSVHQTGDGGYVASGYIWPNPINPTNIYLLKVDSVGSEVWSKSYGSLTGQEEATSSFMTVDGGFIIAGQTDITVDVDHYIVKTDSAGNEEWSRMFGGVTDDWSAAIEQTSDGGYILAGTTYSNQTHSNDLILRKLDGGGEEIWNQTYGQTGDDWGRSVQQTSDDGYILVGITRPQSAVTYDILVIRANSAGSILWEKVITAKDD
jgi:hypothetical protein